MQSVGLVDTEMYGGYELDVRRRAARASSPAGSRCASTASRTGGAARRRAPTTSAASSADVWLASGGRGPLRAAQPGFTPADARYLLYLLAHVRDPGQDRPRGRAAPRRPRAPQGGLDQRRAPRQRHRPLAGRRASLVTRDDLSRRRCGGHLRRARGRRRRGRPAPLPRLSRAGKRQVGARKRTPTVPAVTPSECATAVGVRSREAIFGKSGLQRTETPRPLPGFVRVP